MPRPLLPPRGVFIPTKMIYTNELSPSVIFTWIQLRGLAWDRSETPALSMSQLSELSGKSQSTLYGHMALLRSWGALRMRPSAKGTFIVTFPADTGEFFLYGDSLPAKVDTYMEERDSEFLDSKKLEKGDSLSPSSPLNQPGKLEEYKREGEIRNLSPEGEKINQLDPTRFLPIRNSRNLENNSWNLENESPRSGEKSPQSKRQFSPRTSDTKSNSILITKEGEGDSLSPSSHSKHSNKIQEVEKEGEIRNLSPEGDIDYQLGLLNGGPPDNSKFLENNSENPELPPDLDGADPIKIYQSLTGIRPNKPQREHLKAQIHDTNIWYTSVDHWQSHGWNPKNIAGILELYRRGGPSACRYCSSDRSSPDKSLSALNELRDEFRGLSSGHP